MDANIRQRVISGVLLAAVVIAVCVVSVFFPAVQVLVVILAGITVFGACYEFCAFSAPILGRSRLWAFISLLLPGIFVIALRCVWGDLIEAPRMYAGAMVVAWLSFASFLFLASRERLESAREALSVFCVAFLLISCCGAALLSLASSRGNAGLILWLIAVACVNDIGAYFGGRFFGGPKLHALLSPGKTWSGSVCGLASGVFIGAFTGGAFFEFGGVERWACASVVVVFAAQLADLLKSFLKRIAGVKDSGSIIPGHGGILDRIDATLGASLIGIALAAGGF